MKSQLAVDTTVWILTSEQRLNLCLQHPRLWKSCTIWLNITSLQHCYSCILCLQGCNLNVPPEPCNLVDTIGSCLQHRRIRAILQQILKPSRHCWTLCFGNEKCLDAMTYVPTEPCNMVDTKVVYGTVYSSANFKPRQKYFLSWVRILVFANCQVVYGTVEFVPLANFEAYHRKISLCHESQIWQFSKTTNKKLQKNCKCTYFFTNFVKKNVFVNNNERTNFLAEVTKK